MAQFINMALGGLHSGTEKLSAYDQEFSVPGRAEYGSTAKALKMAGEWAGALYRSNRRVDFGRERALAKLEDGVTIGLWAVPAFSVLYGLEFRVESPLRVGKDIVVGATATIKLATTGDVLAVVPLDAVGAQYIELYVAKEAAYNPFTNDAIEITIDGIPAPTEESTTFGCVELECENPISLCISGSLNILNNALERICQTC